MKREVRLFDELEKFAKGHWLTNAMALTFGYDGDVAYERIWKPLIERFGVPHPLVIADGIVDEGKALGVQVLRIGRAQGLFHPKLFVAVRDEAVLVAVGSANLTKGGLGANLELLTSLAFGPEVEQSAGRSVLESVAGFIESCVVRRLDANPKSIEEVERVCRAVRIVAELLPAREKKVGPAFVHSAETALLDQLRAAHDDVVKRVVVLSPFWELDRPDPEPADSVLCSVMDTLPWSSRTEEPRCLLHAGGIGAGLRLPKGALEKYAGQTELRLQALSKEPRRLHAKLLALIGPKRTTLLWGSPNFTPPALLRPAADGGNVECGLLLSVDAKTLPEHTLLDELELAETFDVHGGELPEPTPLPPPMTIDFVLGELHYEPREHIVSLHGTVISDRVRSIDVRIPGDAEPLLVQAVSGPGTLAAHKELNLERTEEGGLRVLRSLQAILTVRGDDAEILVEHTVRFNVAFTDALELRDNYLLGADALSADALLVPMWSVPERRVAIVDGRIAALRGGAFVSGRRGLGHQPSLDSFYKNVRKGLESRRRELENHRGSRFGLMRWSLALRASLDKARDGALDAARTAYFVSRVSEHIVEVLDALPKWISGGVGPDVKRVIEPDKLVDALAAVRLGDELLDDLTRGARAAQEEAMNRLAAM